MRHRDAFTSWEIEAERRREVLHPDRRPLIDDAIDRPAPAAWHGARSASMRSVAVRHTDARDAAVPTDGGHALADGHAPA